MDLELNGKVVWIAGATGTIGQAIARAFAAEGARVCVSSRRDDAVRGLADELRGALGAPMDATDPDKVKAAAGRIAAECGGLDILVNSMSVAAFGQFLELDKETFEAAIATKYMGYVACMQAVLPHMLDKGSGAIVNITGTGGRLPIDIHMPGGSVNAALNLVTKGIANQYGPEGIRANAVSPGPIRSPRQDKMQAAGQNPASHIPLKRFGEAVEVADAVLFLASPRASYITGSVLQLDGGGVPAL